MTKKQTTLQPTSHKITVAALLTAIAFILQYIEISIPIVPSFIKFDFSDLPALLAAFSIGPVYGVIVELLKNLLHLPVSNSFMIGELSNFLMGASFAFTAGIIYQKHKNRNGAIVASIAGAIVMALVGLPVNYYIIYPLFGTVGFTSEVILDMCRVIVPSISSVWESLLIFNLPFTLVKGLVCATITFVIYKKISPILHK